MVAIMEEGEVDIFSSIIRYALNASHCPMEIISGELIIQKGQEKVSTLHTSKQLVENYSKITLSFILLLDKHKLMG